MTGDVLAAASSLSDVISSLTTWITGFLVGLATLFLTFGAVLYMTAAGDPGAVEKAKNCLKSAAFGYALAMLAPLLVTALESIVGKPS